MSLAEVKRFLVPEAIVDRTAANLRQAGREGCEMFVLWSGRSAGADFVFHSAHAPRQTAYRSRRGLAVRVDGAELHLLNLWLLKNEETLAAQVHAHPTDAFHSETDDAYPIVTALGGLSLVAADFAEDGLLTPESALFRLRPDGWSEVDQGLLTVFADGAS